MNRRNFLTKAALLIVASPIALSTHVVEAASQPTATDWIKRIEVKPQQLSAATPPIPLADVKVHLPFQVLPFIPYKIVVAHPNTPTAVDPLGRSGFVAYKYIFEGEMYGQYVTMRPSYMERFSDKELYKQGYELLTKELRDKGYSLDMISCDSFVEFQRN